MPECCFALALINNTVVYISLYRMTSLMAAWYLIVMEGLANYGLQAKYDPLHVLCMNQKCCLHF